MSYHFVDIIIPTLDNPNYIIPCLNSILAHTQARENIKIIVVNQGTPGIEKYLPNVPKMIKIIQVNKHIGWESSLQIGLEHSKTPIVCFMNDDTYVPYASSLWVNKCLAEFRDPKVASVGPSSNVVRGHQNIFLDQFSGYRAPYANFLIGFCVFYRRKLLDAIGGIDNTLPGGDDFDLSIRVRKAGKKMVICRDTFIYHHGFKTGERLNGTSDKPGGWNSREMSEKTNMGLIKKHGFRLFWETNFGNLENPDNRAFPDRDVEKEVVGKMVKGKVIYDLGCGESKTIPEAIGIDRVPRGEAIPWLEGAKSVADIEADVTDELPIADGSADTIIVRHLLEHCLDTVDVLKAWISKLKIDGRLILTVPDEEVCMTLPMNPEHVHAFTHSSLLRLLELIGMKEVDFKNDYNGISFTAAYERNGHIA